MQSHPDVTFFDPSHHNDSVDPFFDCAVWYGTVCFFLAQIASVIAFKQYIYAVEHVLFNHSTDSADDAEGCHQGQLSFGGVGNSGVGATSEDNLMVKKTISLELKQDFESAKKWSIYCHKTVFLFSLFPFDFSFSTLVFMLSYWQNSQIFHGSNSITCSSEPKRLLASAKVPKDFMWLILNLEQQLITRYICLLYTFDLAPVDADTNSSGEYLHLGRWAACIVMLIGLLDSLLESHQSSPAYPYRRVNQYVIDRWWNNTDNELDEQSADQRTSQAIS